MFRLTKEFRFEAAHLLPHHDGKCARLHGHSWVMRVIVEGDTLQAEGPKVGMIQDYADISKIVKPLVEDRLDHHYLNETVPLVNPTSEELAEWIFYTLREHGLKDLKAVEIDETCTSSCHFEEGISVKV